MAVKRIYLVDDDEDEHILFGIAVNELNGGIALTCFLSGHAALTYAKDANAIMPDLYVLDLNMPVMSGTECLAKLRALPKAADTPVLIYSTAAFAMQKELQALGATFYLSKIEPSKLIRELAYVVAYVETGEKPPHTSLVKMI